MTLREQVEEQDRKLQELKRQLAEQSAPLDPASVRAILDLLGRENQDIKAAILRIETVLYELDGGKCQKAGIPYPIPF